MFGINLNQVKAETSQISVKNEPLRSHEYIKLVRTPQKDEISFSGTGTVKELETALRELNANKLALETDIIERQERYINPTKYGLREDLLDYTQKVLNDMAEQIRSLEQKLAN